MTNQNTKYLLVERSISTFLQHTMRSVYGLLPGTSYDHLFKLALNGDVDAFETLMLWKPNFDLPSEDLILEYQAITLVQSYPHYPMSTDKDRKQAAIDDFHFCENVCKLHADTINKDLAIKKALLTQADLINKILGKAPELETLVPFHGSGASVDARGVQKTALLKAQSTGISVSAIQLANAFENSPGICTAIDKNGFEFHNSALFMTVGKNCLTDRGIEIGASLNTALQQPVRVAMEKRLTKVDINISSHHDPEKLWISKGILNFKDRNVLTPEKHGELARIGSLTGEYVTLDVKSSSNLLAYTLLEVLLSKADPMWWQYFDLTRHSTVTIEGAEHLLHKGAGMGNAIVFPLQTLVYYTACKTACPDAFVSVFGDDIIVNSKYALEVIEYLQTNLGVIINVKKSHYTESSRGFRESCGYDYHNGCRIPKFKCQNLEKLSFTQTSIWLHNSFVRLGELDGTGFHAGLYGKMASSVRKHGADVPIVPNFLETSGYVGPRHLWEAKRDRVHGFKLSALVYTYTAVDNNAKHGKQLRRTRTRLHGDGVTLSTWERKNNKLVYTKHVIDPDVMLYSVISGVRTDASSGNEPRTLKTGLLPACWLHPSSK